MRKIMIADDESLVRIGLQSIINWQDNGFDLQGVYKNGEELLSAAIQDTPDVVLTDIRMPVMDGFTLIQSLRDLDPQIHILILSSYEDFEYTRKAIKLGVKDYIPKHEIEPNELIKVLQSLPYPDNRSIEERAVKSSLKTNRSVNPNASEMGCWLTMKLKPRNKPYNAEEQKAVLILTEELFTRLKNIEFIGMDTEMLHGICLFDSVSDYKSSPLLDKVSKEWKNTVEERLNIETFIGISEYGNWRERSALFRHQAEKILEQSFYGSAEIFKWSAPEWVNFNESEWLELQSTVKQYIGRKRFNEMNELVNDIAEKKQHNLDPLEWNRLYRLTYTYILDFFIDKFEAPKESTVEQYVSQFKIKKEQESYESFEMFRKHLVQLMKSAEEILADLSNKQTWVEQVKDYISEHYHESIRLEDISNLVHLSENYLSLRFREHTGYSFSDYLAKIRIEQAMKLIELNNWTTEEIAYRVGYPNANYFVKVFKKVTGNTVTTFKKKNES